MAAAFRSLLRAAPKLPSHDEQRIRALMRDVARAPPGEDVLPARLCAALQSTYSALRPEGRLGFISLLARQGIDRSVARDRCNAWLSTEDRVTDVRTTWP